MMREFLDILVIWFWQILEGTEASPLYMLLRCINNINIHSGMLIRPFSLFSLSLSNSRCNTQRAILLPSSFVLLQASLSLSLSLSFFLPLGPLLNIKVDAGAKGDKEDCAIRQTIHLLETPCSGLPDTLTPWLVGWH
jgi:hypothetical protein